MNSYLLCTQAGPVLVLSKYDSVRQPEFMKKLAAYGKYIAYEVPVEAIKGCYAAHFSHVLQDPKQTDELRVLDDDGKRVFSNVSFELLGSPEFYEPQGVPSCYAIQKK